MEGIKHYLLGSIIDLFYAIFMALVVFFLLKLIRSRKTKSLILIRLTYIFPLIYLLSDWIENIGIIYYLNSYPRVISGVGLFSTFTTLKQSMAMISTLFLLLLVILRIIMRNKKAAKLAA